MIFVGAIVLVIVVGLLRGTPDIAPAAATGQATSLQTVGILLQLKAFANGRAALTGVEAIANAVPSFRTPGVRRAQHVPD